MGETTLILFIGFIILATYVQTITGFAFGLILMGLVGLSHLLPLADTAIIVSILTLVNAAVILLKAWRQVDVRHLILTFAGAIPFIIIGVFLLNWMANTSLALLQLILGLVIALSSFQLLQRPKAGIKLAPDYTFVIFGAFGGLLNGLFSAAAPPIVHHFYRQPIEFRVIRDTLLAIFACNAVIRLTTIVLTGSWHNTIIWWTLIALPIVIITSYLARRFPPPLGPEAIRRIVFLLLFLSGSVLAIPAALTFNDL